LPETLTNAPADRLRQSRARARASQLLPEAAHQWQAKEARRQG